jgi:FAD:protein FMN transferase
MKSCSSNFRGGRGNEAGALAVRTNPPPDVVGYDSVRRCRPLLGTFVEITASGLDEAGLRQAVAGAFATIERLQNLLSAHDPASELSLLNREAASHAVTVSPETFAVLRLADQMANESGGAFDYTIAPTLAEWGLRPADLQRTNPGNWRDLRLRPGRKVHLLRPLALDLGGIAKGFAVDAAIEVLRGRGVASAIVNAGGDLRVFGPQAATIHLRHPAVPQTLAHTISLRSAALATSSPCFTERGWHEQRVSHLVNPLQCVAITGAVSVTVRARECWLADALTKVVLNTPRRAEKLLAQYEAEAFMLTA